MYKFIQSLKGPSTIISPNWRLSLAILTGMAFALAKGADAELVGASIEVQAVNFPGNGFGRIVLNNGPQQLGESGLTVDASTTTLSDGAELLEVWWSNEDDRPDALANDVNSPSFAGFAVGPPTTRPLIYSKLLISMTRDGEPVAPSNPFGLPPLNNIRPHFHGHDFSVLELSGPPPGGFHYDDQGRLSMGLPSGVFAGQTFYHAGSVPPTQGGTPPPFGDVGGLDMFGYGPVKSEIDGIYNAWVIQQAAIGDSSLDGFFESADLIQVFKAGEYEDGANLNSTWATGDWNGDQEFNSADLTLAFQAGNYEVGGNHVSAVPEPNALSLLMLGGLTFALKRRRSR